MDWGISAQNWTWALCGAATPLLVCGGLAWRYRRLPLGPESAMAGTLALVMLGTLGLRWIPEGGRGGLATGALLGLLGASLIVGGMICWQKRQRGLGGRVTTRDMRR